MKTLRDSIAHRALLVAAALACAAGAWAQDQGAASAKGSGDSANVGASTDASADASAPASDEDLFGEPEVVTQAATSSKEASGTSDFLKYDLVKIGGSFTGSGSYNAVYADPWSAGAQFLSPTEYYITPAITGKVTLVAKPSTDFGVNMDIRTSWPFTQTDSFLNSASYSSRTGLTTTSGSITLPNFTLWSLYSKFNWNDKVYFSFGKQPLAWGVSKGAFQPADDIFAVSSTIDLTDTTAEREGPISLKTTIPIGMTNNLYFYAGIPTDSSGTTKLKPQDGRLAAKAEMGFGNTELALAAYYCYNDHPRALLMGTTGLGSWNLFGEAIAKYGSERYFIEETNKSATNILGLIGTKSADDQLYFTGTGGGYYMDSDSGITLIAQYLYNGEGQTKVSAKEALTYYMLNSSEMDRIKVGTHYGFVSLSDSKLLSPLWGKDKLTGSIIAISNLSDLSGYVMPSLTWSFFDYMKFKIGATFSFGEEGDEYITYGVGQTLNYTALPTKPGVALNFTLTIGTGSF